MLIADLEIFDLTSDTGLSLEIRIAGYKPEHKVPARKIATSIKVSRHPKSIASGRSIRILRRGKLA
jgi:hypothetical protein